jgi:hypothetical protein
MELIPGTKFVELVPGLGNAKPAYKCKKHNKFLFNYVMQYQSIVAQVCVDCLDESGADLETAAIGRFHGRMVPRLPEVNYVAQPRKFICKYCTADFNTWQDMQDHVQDDCVIAINTLRPES